MIVLVSPKQIDFQSAEERKWSKIGFEELSHALPVVLSEIEAPDLLGMGRERCYDGDRNVLIGGYIQ